VLLDVSAVSENANSGSTANKDIRCVS